MTEPQLSSLFSARERQILAALLAAKAVKDIARELELSVNTVKDYLKTIYRKAHVHSARELMLQFGPPPAPAPPDTALAQLLHTAQTLDAHPPAGLALPQLTAAIQRCTRAQRVSYWRSVQSPRQSYFAREPGPGTLVHGAFLGRILTHGWARFEAADHGGFEARQFAAIGLVGEVIGVACAPTARVQILLAGAPVDGAFCPLDLATIRLLARLAHGENGRPLHAFGASA